MEFDLIIKDAFVVDGTGAPGFKGSLAVSGDAIAAVARDGEDASSWAAERVIEAEGLTIAPGFIDMHSHADFVLPLDYHPDLIRPFMEQGVTTVVAGNCGFSPAPLAENSAHQDLLDWAAELLGDRPLDRAWTTMAEFLDHLDRREIAVNLAQLAGHGTIRASLFGRDHSWPGDDGLAQMEALLTEALDAGAFGLSFGLGYEPGMYVERRELEKMAALAAGRGAPLTVHLKALSVISPAYGVNPFSRPHNLRAIEEMLALAEKTGVQLQLSHLIFVGRKTWSTCDRAVDLIERARQRGVDVAFDSFPYTCGNTTIYVTMPTGSSKTWKPT